MTMDLFRKICDEVRTIPQIELMKITGLGEPTLDRLLEERIRYAKQDPKLRTEIYTHGAHLPEKRFHSLKDAGLDSLVFSLNAVRADQHEQVMGLKGKFDIVCKNIEYAIKNRGDMHVEVHAVCNDDTFTKPDVIEFLMRWGHREAGGYGSCVVEGNWAGSTRTVRKFKPNECCFRATTQIYVLYDGQVSACCFDPTAKLKLGDLSKQTIREVYNGSKYLGFREDHVADRADKYDVCRGCTRI